MSLVEACVCLAHSVSVMLGAYACILRAADAYAGNEAFYTHSVHMLQAMWIGAMCVFAYFHVTMETTSPHHQHAQVLPADYADALFCRPVCILPDIYTAALDNPPLIAASAESQCKHESTVARPECTRPLF
jgi:hypothetical protein